VVSTALAHECVRVLLHTPMHAWRPVDTLCTLDTFDKMLYVLSAVRCASL